MSARKRGAGTAAASPGGSTGASLGAGSGRLMGRPIVGGGLDGVSAPPAGRPPGPEQCGLLPGDPRLWLLCLLLCLLTWGLYAVFPRLAGYATGSVLVYVLLPYVLF